MLFIRHITLPWGYVKLSRIRKLERRGRKMEFLIIQVEWMILGSFVQDSAPELGSFHLKFTGEMLYKENMWGEVSGVLHPGLFLIKPIKLLLRIGLE